MPIPFRNLSREVRELEGEFKRQFFSVLESGQFILGRRLKEFEKKAARYLKTPYALGVASGTDALYLGLRVLGIGPGDAVITVPYTFFATAEAISLTSARPLFVDIELRSYNLDGDKLLEFGERECLWRDNRLIHKKTGLEIKAVIPVHLFGQCANMEKVLSFAQRYRLFVIEDAAQSFGAAQRVKKRWLMAGAIGDIGCFSFYPTKNLFAFGDGGLIATKRARFYRKLLLLRNHGIIKKWLVSCIGFNSRLDEVQAAILLVNLRHLKEKNRRRREIFLYYNQNLRDYVVVPEVLPQNRSVFHQYVIRTKERDHLARFLRKQGIATEIYYPLPCHLQPCYKGLGYRRGDFPNAERASEENLALPIDPTLTREELEYIIDAVKRFFTE